ncbi:hypothetical protein PR048_017538 [Dryococelus australis]|uniref:Uncharacterized protein n=1 Tax=Dryococelus australis TaxID=614101 RepID=A0ABQ9HA08_9NEOP|nr:hypothetical protein PR048_017538 [Dryococelus australis]
MRAIEVSTEQRRNERAVENGEKTRRPTASSSTFENLVTRPVNEPGSPCWEASGLTARPPWDVLGSALMFHFELEGITDIAADEGISGGRTSNMASGPGRHASKYGGTAPINMAAARAYPNVGKLLPPHARCHVPKPANMHYSLPLLASHQGDPGSIPGRVTPDFRMWESCRTMPLVGGFPRASPVSLALSFQRCSILTSVTMCCEGLRPNSDEEYSVKMRCSIRVFFNLAPRLQFSWWPLGESRHQYKMAAGVDGPVHSHGMAMHEHFGQTSANATAGHGQPHDPLNASQTGCHVTEQWRSQRKIVGSSMLGLHSYLPLDLGQIYHVFSSGANEYEERICGFSPSAVIPRRLIAKYEGLPLTSTNMEP